MSTGEKIRKRRKELKITQQELSTMMGYKTRSTIAKIESGENDLPHAKLVKMAKLLNTNVEYLIDSYTSLPNAEKKIVAVILAGGKSTRNQQNIPNQFITIDEKPIIMYCMETYEKHPSISEIYVVCSSGWTDIVSAYAKEYGISKFIGTIPSGSTGILSIKNSITYLSKKYIDSNNENEIKIVFQESTRPMVTADMISKVLQWCNESGNAIMSEPMDEYLQFTVDSERSEIKKAVQCINRNYLFAIQSPEAHQLIDLITLFKEADTSGHIYVESCLAMLMFNMGKELLLFEGNHNNLKIIRQEDIAIFTSLCK